MIKPVSIIGAGAWGTALAHHFHQRAMLHSLYSQHDETLAAIARQQVNPRLPAVTLAAGIPTQSDFSICCQSEIIFLAGNLSTLPAHVAALKPHYTQQHLIICAKGIDSGNVLPHEIVTNTIPKARPLILSGPSFATDVARNLPVAATLAGSEPDILNTLLPRLFHPLLRLYPSTDLLGVSLCGALKNVLAIASGIARGKEVGRSGEAGLITRGLAEMTQIVTAAGGKAETCSNLSGLGDLVLTCGQTQSRNMQLGIHLAAGKSLVQSLDNIATTAEGARTAKIIPKLVKKYEICMPIMETVHRILYEDLPVQQAMHNLLRRSPRSVSKSDPGKESR